MGIFKNSIESIKDMFSNYEDEDYVSNLIVEDDDYYDYDDQDASDYEINDYHEYAEPSNSINAYEDELNINTSSNDMYNMKIFTEPASEIINSRKFNFNKADRKEASNMNNQEPRLVNFKDVNSQKMIVIRPNSLEEGQEVAAQIRAGKICVVNFEDTDSRLAQRIIDFLTGAAYSLGGTVSPISSLIFVVAPLNVAVSEGSGDSSRYDENRDYSDLRRVVNGL